MVNGGLINMTKYIETAVNFFAILYIYIIYIALTFFKLKYHVLICNTKLYFKMKWKNVLLENQINKLTSFKCLK